MRARMRASSALAGARASFVVIAALSGKRRHRLTA
jgi:hypothetical protein